MLKRSSILVTLLLAPAAAAAAAAQPQAQVEAVIRCLDVADVEERVRCYDRAATALRSGLRSGQVVVAEPPRSPTPSRLQARITSATSAGGRWVMVLDNGQTWRTHEVKAGRPPAAGSVIRISRNLIGTYWMTGQGVSEVRVHRVE